MNMKKIFFLLLCTIASLLTSARIQITGSKVPADTSNIRTEIYKTVGTLELKMKLIYPSNHKASKPLPAIAFFFGGGWVSGSINQFMAHAGYLASRGMIAVLVDYRVKSRHHTSPVDAATDAKSAIRYLRANAGRLGIDPSHLAAGGGSAGGHLAAVTGNAPGLDQPGEDLSVSSKPNALILFNPVFDNGPNGYGFEACGGEAHYREISPIDNIRKGAPPTIVFLGTSDKLIPVAVAQNYKKLMEEAGSRCDLFLYEGQQHGFFNKGKEGDKYFIKTLYQCDIFLTSLGYLKGKPTFKDSE
jgi:acetyl esterase